MGREEKGQSGKGRGVGGVDRGGGEENDDVVEEENLPSPALCRRGHCTPTVKTLAAAADTSRPRPLSQLGTTPSSSAPPTATVWLP